jgi:pyruvate,water dikinase
MPWREQPDFMLKMVADYTPLEQKTAEKVRFENIHLPLMKRWMVRKIYLRARQFSLYREHISSLYTYGYGLFRIYFLALGDQFVMRGVIHAREDIFFISDQEMRKIINNLSPQEDFAALIEQRKREMEQYKDLIPPNTIYGDQVPAIDQRPGLRLTGTPTSKGYYTGRVKVVRGLGDFLKLQLGDVLVVPYSDVGWTPLFSKAGGVISESGGMLSHSSIIAREYNIPAVVSVANATVLLHDQALVTVNGYIGEVIMHELSEEP